jgi:uncharacterized protein YegP (UPF0339 family)
VILRNEAGKFRWRAVGDNNEIMAASQMMERKQSCLDSIATVQDPLYQLRQAGHP